MVALLPRDLSHLEAHIMLGWKLNGNHIINSWSMCCCGCWHVSLVQVSIPLSLRIRFRNLSVFGRILFFSRLETFAFFIAAECNRNAADDSYNNASNAWSFKRWWSLFQFTLSDWITHSLVSLADHVRVVYDENWSRFISFQPFLFRHCLNFRIILLFGHLGPILQLGLSNLHAVITDEIVIYISVS